MDGKSMNQTMDPTVQTRAHTVGTGAGRDRAEAPSGIGRRTDGDGAPELQKSADRDRSDRMIMITGVGDVITAVRADIPHFMFAISA